MFDMRIKSMFFDTAKVKRAVDGATRESLSRGGAMIRTIARRSMRRRRAPSQPGQPPSVHEGSLKRLLFYGYQPREKSVVVGSVGRANGSAPNLMEFGGRAKPHKNRRRRVRYVGGAGEIRRRGKRVIYATLTSPAQVERANKIQEEIYGPAVISGAKIDARPYMGPALRKAAPSLPSHWANSVRD